MLNNLVSIIIPFYNAQEYLVQCIQSVIGQTYTHLELILINDGSNDRSLRICQEYANIDKRIRIINIENHGVSNARNLGIDNAQGDHIMFVDSDDWLDKETLVKCMNHQKKVNADVVLFSFNRVSGSSIIQDKYIIQNQKELKDTNNFKKRVVGFFDNSISEPTKTDAFNTPWAKLYKRSAIGELRYIDRAKVGMEDVLFNIEVINASYSYSFLDEYLYNYRLDNPQSLTKTDTNSLYYKFEKLFNHIENANFFNETYRRNLNNRVACSMINICLSLTHYNNRMGFLNEWRYLKTVLHSKRYSAAYKSFIIKGMPSRWSFFFFLAKYKLTTALLLLSYIIRLIK